MPKQDLAYLAFNRGLCSRLGMARLDVKRIALSAEVFTNYMVRVLGSMMLRPGMQYTGATKGNNKSRSIPFVFSLSDKARIEITGGYTRIWVDDALVTRESVSTAITNPNFTSDVSGWTCSAGATWEGSGNLQFVGNGETYQTAEQMVTVAVADRNVEHAVRITVTRGPVVCRIGQNSGSDEYVRETSLDTGVHSLAFTPTNDFYIRVMSRLERAILVSSIDIEAAGVLALESPWVEADLGLIRTDQTGDVVFVACAKTTDNIGYMPRKIERRGTTSWSIVQYETEDGPFRNINASPTTMTPSALTGNGTLTASDGFFKAGHLGALFSVVSKGQKVTQVVSSAAETFSNPITVTGVTDTRVFTITIDGDATLSTIVLQRSLTSEDGPWENVATKSWTADTDETYDDGLDNQIAYYRIGAEAGAWNTPDVITVTLSYAIGSITGICRVTEVSSSTIANMEVLRDFGGTDATDEWSEGKWSDYRGWPTVPKIHEGRLWWAGRDSIAGSVSDDYYSFDSDYEGDAGPIIRSIGSGPVDKVNWLLSLQRLILGGQMAEHSCKSNSFDEPLTPTNFQIKKASTQGSAPVEAIELDGTGVYVQRGGSRAFDISFNNEKYDFASGNLTQLTPDIGSPGIVRMGLQRQPDTRIHFVRSDGTAAVLVFDKTENVTCWLEVESSGGSGFIEDVCILPGDDGSAEDEVYYTVRRTINGSTVRYHEKWSLESECHGGSLCKIADSFITYTGSAATVVTGLSHLEGESVIVWADGADVGHDANDAEIYTVSGGQITLATAASNVVVGLGYTAQWQSSKLLQLQAQASVVLDDHKNIQGLGLVLADAHYKGVQFGPDFDNLDDLPSVEEGAPVAADTVHADYNAEPFIFPGTWTVDARVCLQSIAPRPCTMLALICQVEHHD